MEPSEIDLIEFQGDVQEENQEDGDIGGNGYKSAPRQNMITFLTKWRKKEIRSFSLARNLYKGETTIPDLTEFQGDVQEENHEDGDIGGNGEVAPSGGDANITKEHL
ncbi:hypothetical protein Tco_1553450 [Tanacetum coccineum]